MADKKISDFATLTDLQSNDLLLVSSLNETYNTKVETLMDSIKGDGVVLFDKAQSLTTQEKQQARNNIGAADADDLQDAIDNSVHVNESQNLTEAQKAQARENIGINGTGGAIGTITLGTSWSSGNPHTQTVTVSDYTVTENTKIDLLVTPTSLSALRDMGVSGIQAYNNDGTVIVYAYGKSLTESVMLYCLCSEVVNDAPEPGPDIPSEYQQVEYIQSDGSGQYIDTGLYADDKSYMMIDVQFNAFTAGEEMVHGYTGNRIGSARFGLGIGTDNKWYCGSGSKNNHSNADADLNRHIMYLDIPNSVWGVDSAELQIETFTMANTALTFYLFARRADTGTAVSAYTNCKLYSAVVKNGGVVVAHFVPCYVKSTGVIGLYDTVRNQFFTNSGTGTFTKGADV